MAFAGVLEHILELLVDEDHIDAVFSSDFIFFFILASNLHWYVTIKCIVSILLCSFYSWETCPINLILMIEKCVTKLMQLDPTDIAKNQQEFIKL